MYDLSGELQKLGEGWQYIKKQHRSFMWRDLTSKSKRGWRLENYPIKISKQICSFGELKRL